jgi:nucleoside-diphosphate-sugar epimerase
MNKKVLILGSSGFLGSKVGELLVDRGFIIDFCDLEKKENFDNFYNMEISDFFKFKKFDLTEYDYIVDVATVLPFKNDNKKTMYKNIETVKNLVNCKFKINHHIIYVSSSGLYGKPDDLPIVTNTKFNTLDNYAESKLKAEKILITSKLNYSIIRPKAILGNGRAGIFEIFFNLIKKGMPLPIPNGGKQIMQFVDVYDVASMICFLIEKNLSGIYPAAAPNYLTLSQYLENIEKIYGIKVKKININPKLFEILGKFLVSLNLTNFTKWHFAGYSYSSYFDSDWKPYNFEYKYSSLDTFLDTAKTYLDIQK